MRGQRSQAGHVFSGMAELFELYLLHAFHTFADVPLAELAQGGQPRQVCAPFFALPLALSQTSHGSQHFCCITECKVDLHLPHH